MIDVGSEFQFGDNMRLAIVGLDIFTKNYCKNVEETDKQKDLVFRCKDCEFLKEDSNFCLIKEFVNKHKPPGYDLSSFGSMSR